MTNTAAASGTAKHYAQRDHEAQGAYYINHVSAMTGEGLHAKSAIAAELAHRDIEIETLRAALIRAHRAINSMKVEAETAGACGDEQMLQEACETISNEGLAASMAIDAALAAPAQPVAPKNPWRGALEIRMAQGWKLKGGCIPVLYTDTINGDEVGRDDLVLCTTEELKPAETAAPAQAGEYPEIPTNIEHVLRRIRLCENEVAAQVVMEHFTRSAIYADRAARGVAQAAPSDADVLLDAERYRLLRRGQRWSSVDGVGNTLRADELDSAIDAARAAQGGAA